MQRLAAYESTARPKASERIPVIKISKDRIYIITRVGVRRSGFSEDNFVQFCARCREVVAALLRVGSLRENEWKDSAKTVLSGL